MAATGLGRDEIERVLARACSLSGDDRDFFLRVWTTDPEIYRARIRAVGFEGLGDILDAGCGFGQWTLPLAENNRSVKAIDVSPLRADLVRDVADHLGAANVEAAASSIEATPFADAAFDGIFSYSVVYFTDYRRSIAEFARLLRPGGRLYLCSNGLGWYLHNLTSAHNATATFDPAAMAVATLENSLGFYAEGRRREGRQIVTPSSVLRAELERNGFDIVAICPEGTYHAPGMAPGASFYRGDYHGAEGVYEIIATRRADV